jgi:hypothetical protein
MAAGTFLNRYKQAYSIEKDATGPDCAQLAYHLQKLGAACASRSRWTSSPRRGRLMTAVTFLEQVREAGQD